MLKSMTLLLLLAAAVTKDMQTYRIPNALLAAGAANGCILQFYEEGWSGVCDAFAGAVWPFLLCGGLFILSMIGAGDIKLLMVIGIYLGSPSILRVMLYACLIGAAFALVKILGYGLISQRKAYLLHYFSQIAKPGCIRPYIDMDSLSDKKVWLMHFSVPILLAAIYEML